MWSVIWIIWYFLNLASLLRTKTPLNDYDCILYHLILTDSFCNCPKTGVCRHHSALLVARTCRHHTTLLAASTCRMSTVASGDDTTSLSQLFRKASENQQLHSGKTPLCRTAETDPVWCSNKWLWLLRLI